MSFFHRSSKKNTLSWNPETETPVMHLSICTGEKTVGFKNKQTNKLERAVYIHSDADLKLFCQTYGITEDMIAREW